MDVVAFSLNFVSIDPDPSLIGGCISCKCLVALMSEINREVGAFSNMLFQVKKEHTKHNKSFLIRSDILINVNNHK